MLRAMQISAFLFIILAVLLIGSPVAHAEDLLQIYQAIQQNDPNWRSKQHAWEAGKQSKGIGRAYMLPNVVFSGEHKEVKDQADCPASNPMCVSEDEYDSTGYQLQVVQPLFNKEKWHIYRQNRAHFELAELEYESALQSNIYDTAVLYFEVIRTQVNYNLAQGEQKALETQLREISAKAEAGVSDQTEVIETQASFDLATVRQITELGYLKVAYEDLITRTGIANPTILNLSQDYPIEHLKPFNEKVWTDKAKLNSPNVKALHKSVEIAKQNMRRNTSGVYPTVELFASIAHQDQEGGNFVVSGEQESVGIRVQWPLFVGLGDYYTNKQQRAQFMQSTDDALAEEQKFMYYVTNRFRSIYTDVLSVDARKKALASSERALRAVRAQYEIGSRDMIDVLNAQRNFFSAQREYAHARIDYVLHNLQLKLFVGELSEQDLKELNQWLVNDPELMGFESIP